MSETPGERQTGLEKRAEERVGCVDAEPHAPGSRTLQAGAEFLKALVSDLAAIASRLRLPPITTHRQARPPRASAPTRVSQRAAIGGIVRRLSVVLLALGTICAGALSAVTLWVLFGFPAEPRKSDADTLGAQFEARKGASLGGVGPLNLTGASQQNFRREPGAQGRPIAEASDDRSYRGSGTSSGPAAEPAKAVKETQTEPGAGADQPQLARTEPQDRRPAARQPQISGMLTDLRPRTQCNVDLCAATYKSFHPADCTYQPYGGAPRSICELSTRPADAPPQTSRAGSAPRSEAPDTRVAEGAAEIPRPATSARVGAQCNIDLCAATYASFHAADCTYQPHGGGARRICDR